jgi:MYXO-CTERM domain-containing protein
VSAVQIATAIVAAALAAPAAAFVRSASETTGAPLFWPAPLVPYHVSDAEPFVPSPTCAGPAGDAPALDAVRAGFSAWHQGCANLELVFAGRIAELRTGAAGSPESLVVFRKGWCSVRVPSNAPCRQDPARDCSAEFNCFEDDTPGDRSIVALTSVLYEPQSGRIVDADMEVNGWDGVAGAIPSPPGSPLHGWYFTCAGVTGTECTSYGQGGCHYMDLQNTVTHEAGHFLGLAHPCEGAACNNRPDLAATTMFPSTAPGDVEKLSLSGDDVAGVCAIYPEESGGSGCSSGGAAGALAAVAALAAAALRRRRERSARS